jgi:FkbM family methyltransferase
MKTSYKVLIVFGILFLFALLFNGSTIESYVGETHKSNLTPSQERRLVELMKPVDVEGISFERLGVDGDGGYVVPLGHNYSNHICLGVGADVTYENAILNRIKGQVVCFDHTVSKLPDHADPRIKWVKKGVGEKENAELTTLPRIMEKFNSKGGDMSLKMDIEGWEFPVLKTMSRDDLNKFDLIVTELHCMGNNGDKGAGDSGPIKDSTSKLKALEQICDTHYSVHTHPTPHCLPLELSDGTLVPYVAEFTFVKKAGRRANKTQRTFPTELDESVVDPELAKRRKECLRYITK